MRCGRAACRRACLLVASTRVSRTRCCRAACELSLYRPLPHPKSREGDAAEQPVDGHLVDCFNPGLSRRCCQALAISLFVALPYVERRCCQMVCNGLSVGAFCIQSLVNMMVPSSPKTGTLVDRFALSLENVMLSSGLQRSLCRLRPHPKSRKCDAAEQLTDEHAC